MTEQNSRTACELRPVTFRWPIKQVGPFTVEMQVPLGGQGIYHVEWNDEACRQMSITPADKDRASDMMREAALNELMIVK